MPEKTPFRIAVVGGGIGGLFAALCIHFHCTSTTSARPLQIHIYEQAPEYKEIGAGIGIGVNAARLVHKLGLGDRLNSIASHKNGVWISFRRFDNGEEIVTMPMDETQSVRHVTFARSELLQLLKSAVEERSAATLHTDKCCEDVEDLLEHGVRLHFRDGSDAEADLVVGADGIHSSIRAKFATDNRINSGQIAYRDVIPTASLGDWSFQTQSVAWLAKHKHFLVYPISKNRQLNIVAFVTKGQKEVADVKESWTTVCERSEVGADFKDFEPTVQNIISHMKERPSKWRINDREPMKTWHFLGGKVILLGDAAHAMLPHLGNGAAQAMEDGWVLARALSEYLAAELDASQGSSPLAGMAELYQETRLGRAQKVQAMSRAAGDTYEMQTEDMLHLSFEECCPVIAERTRERMKWVWEEDLDVCYEDTRRRLLLWNIDEAGSRQ